MDTESEILTLVFFQGKFLPWNIAILGKVEFKFGYDGPGLSKLPAEAVIHRFNPCYC